MAAIYSQTPFVFSTMVKRSFFFGGLLPPSLLCKLLAPLCFILKATTPIWCHPKIAWTVKKPFSIAFFVQNSRLHSGPKSVKISKNSEFFQYCCPILVNFVQSLSIRYNFWFGKFLVNFGLKIFGPVWKENSHWTETADFSSRAIFRFCKSRVLSHTWAIWNTASILCASLAVDKTSLKMAVLYLFFS